MYLAQRDVRQYTNGKLWLIQHDMLHYHRGCLDAMPMWLVWRKENASSFFFVLLTVHLSTVLVINQLDAQNLCFIISLLYASTCFKHYVLIIRRSKLYCTASGIVTPIGGRPVHRLREDCSPLSTGAPDGHLQCDDTRCCIIQFWPPDDEQHVEAYNKLIIKQEFVHQVG